MESTVKRVHIKFHDGLPLGVHGSFKHDGQNWIAVPVDKYTAIVTVTDRLIGALDNIRGQMTRWAGTRPEDAERVVMLLDTISRANGIARQATIDKAEAQTL